MPLLEVKDVDIFYGDFQAVFGVSLILEAGAVAAIIGANGAGKSTLLKCIMGLNPAGRGQIVFDGQNVTGERADRIARKGVALVPEGRRLFRSLSVEENLDMGTVANRKGPWTLGAVYDLFPAMRDFRKRLPSQISGGQQQMVSISRALLTNPRLLLCDELSLGLAPKVVGEIYACFDRIRATGISIIIVEQDIMRARSASEMSYCLLEGRVSLSGKSSELTDQQIATAYFGT